MTSVSDKNIPVYFAPQTFWDEDMAPSKLMGKISYTDMIKIMTAMEDYNATDSACTYKLGIKYVADITPDTYVYARHRLHLTDSVWGYKKTFPKCIPGARGSATPANMFLCAQCLRDGKCCDEFMSKKIGAVLYPQLYANEKQK